MFYQRAPLSVLLSVWIFFNDLNIVFYCNTINNYYNSSYVKKPIIQWVWYSYKFHLSILGKKYIKIVFFEDKKSCQGKSLILWYSIFLHENKSSKYKQYSWDDQLFFFLKLQPVKCTIYQPFVYSSYFYFRHHPVLLSFLLSLLDVIFINNCKRLTYFLRNKNTKLKTIILIL